MTKQASVSIAIDAMGGDIGLDTTLAAVITAQAKHPDLFLILVGEQAAIKSHQLFSKIDLSRAEIFHCTQVVDMDEAPANVLRHKNDSSMWKAIELVRDGKAHACVSAGNTGALMASARYILKMLPGISRPAICATLPTLHGHVHWLDLGANVDSKPEQLEQFAVMGSELTRAVDNNASPKVGLLNIGEEAIKGNDVVKEAGKLLQNAPINYIGHVEGNDIFLKKELDVVVCDGFVGNVALKTVEGLAKFIQKSLEAQYKRSLFTKIAALLSLPVLKRLKTTIDPRMYNGATLLGLQGIVVKSHGNADAFAFANAIKIARLEVKNGVIDKIRDKLPQPTTSLENNKSS
ncbi:phosphate acyltransferase PlsX [Suttonella ornithocola]|uniref:Phosphate acyltransferase n=1 Tax=Suttonella ornithocola TaxID=279832 RepID=A0A380N043_9GAMM|nr:phosphate acyltransferase PlsX [Suttonella ornithocola]SUO97942.1 Phosphate acyltransferase [Suttonella ornithocola]